MTLLPNDLQNSLKSDVAKIEKTKNEIKLLYLLVNT